MGVLDNIITTVRIKTALLASAQVGALGIDVDTEDDVVYLRGEVETEREARMAEEIVWNMGGIKRVVNELRWKRAEAEEEAPVATPPEPAEAERAAALKPAPAVLHIRRADLPPGEQVNYRLSDAAPLRLFADVTQAVGTVTDPASEPHTKIIFVISGRAQVMTEAENYLLAEGDLIVLPPRTSHRVEALQSLRMLWLGF